LLSVDDARAHARHRDELDGLLGRQGQAPS
jgi:hypothetical protein